MTTVRAIDCLIPEWAQTDSIVRARCRADLAYRCQVCTATTKQYIRFLINEAHGLEQARQNG